MKKTKYLTGTKIKPSKAPPDAGELVQSQQQLAALMTAVALKPSAICKRLNMTRETYNIFLRSGVFKALVADYRQKLVERGLEDAHAMLLGDAHANIAFLRQVRDGAFDDDPKRMHIRLRASQTLLEKQLPKNQESFDPQRVADAMRKIAAQATAEVGDPIEIEATPLDDAIEALENGHA